MRVARPRSVFPGRGPRGYRLAAVGDVAIAVIAAPDKAAIDRVFGVDHLVDLDGLIVAGAPTPGA